MLPDSTVIDPKKAKKKRKSDKAYDDNAPSKKTKKKPDPIRKKAVKKKVKKKVEEEDFGSDMDLDKELHPIAYYIRDRKQMISQMFASLKKGKVKSLLPDILKNHSLDEVEELCYEQVQVMSRKRIFALINGKRAEDISSSGTDDNSSDDDVTVIKRVELDPPDSTGVTSELPNIEDVVMRVKPATVAIGSHSKPAHQQKLELLELEMRARAIKKMLMSQQADVESEGDNIQEIDFSERKMEDEILKHMASEQPSTSSAAQSREVITLSDEKDKIEECIVVSPKPAAKLVRKRTESEMEPGELSEITDDEECNIILPEAREDNSPANEPVAAKHALTETVTDSTALVVNEVCLTASSSDGDKQEADGSLNKEDAKSDVAVVTKQSDVVGLAEQSETINTDINDSGKDSEEPVVDKGDSAEVDIVASESCQVSPGRELSEGEISNDELEEIEVTAADQVDAACDEEALSTAKPSECEDIFVDDNDNGSSTPCEAATQELSAPLVDEEVEDVNSALYEDVPSPGKYIEEPQVNVVSQSTNALSEASSTLAGGTPGINDIKAADSDDSNGLVAAKPTVTSTDSLYKSTALNWSKGLDVNIDQLDSDSDREEKRQEAAIDDQVPVVSNPTTDKEQSRVPTPEITAQRYRSQTLNIALELIDDKEKADKGKQTIEIRTKIYSSASTSGGKTAKSSKSKSKTSSDSKSKKHGLGKRVHKSKHVGDEASSKRKDTPSSKQSRKHSSETSSRHKSSNRRSETSDPSISNLSSSHKVSTKQSSEELNDKHSDKMEKSTCKSSPDHSDITLKHKSSPDHSDITLKHKLKHTADEAKPCKDRSSHEITASTDSRSRNKEAKSQRTKDTSQNLHNSNRRSHTPDKSCSAMKCSVFDRLSGVSTESPSLSSRFKRYGDQKSSSSTHSPYSKEHRRSQSPRDRYDRHNDRHSQYSHANSSRLSSRDEQSRHVSHDDRSERVHKNPKHSLDPDYVSPKRYRSEWEVASKVITLKDQPSVVKTFESFKCTKKRRGSKHRPVAVEDDSDKSPVRFPSPDIKVIANSKVNKAQPLLVVLSDSD